MSTTTFPQSPEAIQHTLSAELQAVMARLRRVERQDEGSQTTGASGGDFHDLLEQAQHSVERELDRLEHERLAERARRLSAALDRLARGDYGRCEECDAPIARARLQAIPDAARCVRCQERREGAPVAATP